MAIKRFKKCRTCGKQEPRGWTEDADYICGVCRHKTVAEVLDPLVAHKRRADRDAQQDQIMEQPGYIIPFYSISQSEASERYPADWDNSSHRHHDSHTSHDTGSSYDSPSDSSTPSGGSFD